MIAAFDGVFRKRVCRRLGGLVQVLAGVLVLASVGVGMAATAPGVSDWHPASGAMASDAADEAVMVQAAAPDANTQRLVFRFPSVVLGRGADGLLDVSLPSTGQWRQPGEPVLPMISTRVALPQGHVLVSFTVVPSDASETVLDAPVRHAQRPFPLSRPQDRVATPASAAIYGADSPYPAALHTDGSVQTKRGVGFVDLALFPVSYRPASGRLTAYGTLTLEVVTKAVKPSGLAVSSADAGWRARLRSVDDLALLQSLMENPQTLASYQPKETSDAGVVSLASAADPGQPSLPCHLGDLFQHVIITTRDIRDGIVEAGTAIAQIFTEHAYLFIYPDAGTQWTLDTQAVADAGGYPVEIGDELEQEFVDGRLDALGVTSNDWYFAYEFNDPALDGDANGVPDWMEILDGTVTNGLPFRFTYVAFTNRPLDNIVALRQAQGLSSTVISIESIMETYQGFGMEAEQALRSFLRDAYDKWITEYVVIVGDGQVMPMRQLRAVGAPYIDDLPSDLYFQCLDGSFDSDGNGIYGEPTDGADRLDGRPGEDIDLYAELAIGRVAIQDAVAMSNWVAKVARYETDRLAGTKPYLRGALLLGEYLGFGGVSDYATPMMEEIRLGTSEHGYRTEGFAALDIHTNIVTLYDDERPWTKYTAAAYINSNQFSVLNHLGHSDYNYNLKFYSRDIPFLLNNDRPAFLYTQGCWPGAFDMDCIAGEFLGGSSTNALFGGVFNSRYGWGDFDTTDGPSQRYNRWFWHGFFGELIPVTGILNQMAHERNAARIDEDYMRWCYYESNLHGDPAQWLFGIEPSVTLDREAYRSTADAKVDVILPQAGPTLQQVVVTVRTYTAFNAVIATTNVTCYRVGPTDRTARFGSLPFSLAGLGAVNGGKVRAEATLSLGGVAVLRYDVADITDVPPQVVSYTLTADETYIDFSFTTDYPVTSEARIGDSIPLTADWQTVSDTRATLHSIRFEGLEPFTPYFIGVRIEDAAGNVVSIPSNLFSEIEAEYFTVATIGREITLRTDWERGNDGWTVTNINGGVCWEYGQPLTYGPQDDSRCWGTVLNGRYPDGANAVLTSPPFGVRERPMLIFRHWMDVQYSMDMEGVSPSPPPFGDYGQIEVLSSGVWYNVTAYIETTNTNSYLTGQSAGWQDVRVNLPAMFANQPLSVRFRFVSDQQSFGAGNPAGWYIDAVTVQDVPGSGLGISQVDLSDVNGFHGLALVGDTDGYAEAGETVALRPYLFNYGTTTFGNLSGTLTVQIGGYPATNALLLDGAPADIDYTGPIAPADLVPANDWVRLQLAPGLAPGTVVTLLQSVTNAAGLRLDSRYDLVIRPVVPISGLVIDATTSNAIAAATVTAVRESMQWGLVTGADGRFVFNGLNAGDTYTLTAGKPGMYAPQTQMVMAPASNVLFRLGMPIASYAPTSLAFTVVAGGSDGGAVVFSNAVNATAPLNVALEQIDYHPAATGWLAVEPLGAQLEPGTAALFSVTVDAGALRAGTYLAELVFRTDDSTLAEVRIPVEVTVWREPILAFGGLLFEDDYFGDGDGQLEAGETARVWVYLNNSSGLSDVVDVTGTLSSTNTHVTINPPPTLHWQYIAPYSSRLSTNGVEVVLDLATPVGEVIDFNIELVYFDGLVWQTNQTQFSYTYTPYHSVSGIVEGVKWDEKNQIPNGTTPVAGARVTAEDIDGNLFSSTPTDTNGVYVLPPLPHGDLWFKVYEPDGTSYVPPAGTNIFVGTGLSQDFLLNNYGTNGPILRFEGVSVYDYGMDADYDGAFEPGETLYIYASVYNEGRADATNVTDLIALADMGAYGPFMQVTQATTFTTNTIYMVPEWARQYGYEYLYSVTLYYFEATVNADAVEGGKQRFWLTTTDGGRVWPFDFSITVASRYSISGQVTYEAGPAAAPDITVLAELPDGTVMTDITDWLGYYEFEGFEPGTTGIVVRAIPSGDYAVEPLSYVLGPLTNDVTGLDFVLKASQLFLSPSPLTATVNEGESTNAFFTIQNASTNATTVDLSVVYNRGDDDLLPPPLDDPLSLILTPTTTWNKLDADAYVPGELEVRFADGTGWMEREAILKRHGLRAVMHLKLVPACLAVPIDTAALGDAKPLALAPLAQALQADPGVLYVQPAARMEPSMLPDDPLFDKLYGLHNTRQTGGTLGADVNVEGLWDRTTGSRDIIVAVCDTGFDKTHPDLLPNLWTNPAELSGDASYDGYPGFQDVDDDGDVTNQLYHFDEVSGTTVGPELVHPLFDADMWKDNQTRTVVPGVPGTNQWVAGANGKPDFFELYLNGELLFTDLPALYPAYFGDSDGDGIPNAFEDGDGDGIPDIFADEDGDGIINETGIDFRDEDVMLADYNNSGQPLIKQVTAILPWMNSTSYRVVLEQWNLGEYLEYSFDDGETYAADDDDENGYADDLNGWNFYHGDGDVTDGDVLSSHGSHVAGTIGAVGSNAVGVAGVNWNVSIMPLALVYRAEDPYTGSPFTSSARIAKAIEYAITHGARVSNHSWGGGAASGVLYEIMKVAERDYNHLFVIAAGNSANDVDNRKFYPAYFSTVLNNVITVAAADHHDQLAEFSNYGRNSVQLAAPGVDIYSTWSSRSVEILGMYPDSAAYLDEMLASGELILDDGAYYRRMSGTSMAAPHVTGAAALLWSLSPDANYSVIKRALLDGVRLDSNLDGWVKTDGLLDLGRSVEVMGTDWLTFSSNRIAVAAGDSVQVEVFFNPGLDTPPGVFQAEIVGESDIGRDRLPVTLTVLAGGMLEVDSVLITDDTDHDGFAEPGETVSFMVGLNNPGNFTFINLSGTLSVLTPGTAVTTAMASWDYLYGGQHGESLTAFTVTIPGGAPAETLFALTLTADGLDAQTLEVALPTQARYAVAGRVVTTGGSGIEGAMVEYRGAAGGSVLSGANGVFSLYGLPAGDFLLRAIPTGYARSADQSVTLAATDVAGVELEAGAPVVTLSPTHIQASLVNEMNWIATVALSNTAADAFGYTLDVMPRRRIGLFADGTSLGVLVAPLERMGFEVDYFTNNYATVHEIDPATALEEIVQDVRYTDDDATVFPYAMVIADLTGPHGGGRVFSDAEADVFSRYLDLGGAVLFTGGNPLNRPDNAAIASMCGVELGYVSTSRVSEAQAVTNWNGVFVTLAAGDRLSVSNFVHDLATPTNAATEVLFTAGAASKLTRLAGVGVTGQGLAMYWGGNPGAYDWQREGVWLDVLRDILHERFMQPMATQTSVPWLTATPVSGSVAAGAASLSVTLSSGYMAADTYQAVILLRGLNRDEEVMALPVSLTVSTYMLRAYSSTGVMDAQGVPLRGDGSDASPLYQVIYAGTNGLADTPNTATGAPGGDDRLLAVIPSGQAFGRFGSGEGVPSNQGRFDQRFVNTMPTNNVRVYVRAWDGATFASSLVYGDSGVSNKAFSTTMELDFGTWVVNRTIALTLDSNGDSLPDDWLRQYRPDLDPLAVNDPLETDYDATVIATISAAGGATPQPHRVRFSIPDAAFMFVLDKANNRLVTIPTNSPTTQVLFGGAGTGNGKFAQPEGLAVDPRAGHYRLAVADTGNNRIQLFTYNPTNGVISFERAVGTFGSGGGQFNRPGGVAFDNTGRVFVADTGNNRVAIFRASDGVWFSAFSGTGAYILSAPRGIAFDTHISDGGVWVCDTGNDRMTLYFDSGVFRRSVGVVGTSDGRFNDPVDAAIWLVGARRRLVVADKVNNRMQVFNTDGSHLGSVGTGGSLLGQLLLPHGVAPLNDSGDLFVADTGNARIQRFSLTLDADGDGMNDFWEDMNGLNSLINDAHLDLDGDGLFNLGEYVIGTNPNNLDTNGDGMWDGVGVQAGLDPLDVQPSPPPGTPPFEIASLALTSSGGGGLTIQWESEDGAVYQIETRISLLSGIWDAYAQIVGSGGTSSADMPPPGGGFLFFRIRRIY